MQRPASTSAHSAVSPRPPAPAGHQVNTQTKVLDTIHGRILCVADIRGRLSALNDLAREANAQAVIHTGDFGFFGEYLYCNVWYISVISWRRIEQSGQDQ